MTRFQTAAEDFATRILRRWWVRWPPRQQALERAFKRKEGRAFIYTCEKCGVEFKRKELAVHHIVHIFDPAEGWVDMDTFVRRLFCNAEGLAVLCGSCHSEVHSKDAKVRANTNKKRPLGGKKRAKKCKKTRGTAKR